MNTLGLRKLQVFCVAAAAALGVFAGAASAGAQAPKQRLVTQAVDESNRVTLHGNVHPFARAEFDQGAIADSQPVNRIYVLLSRSAEQQAALDQLMREQVDANSPNYHKWLTPAEYGTKFGPSDDDVAAVTSWLSSHGFTGVKTNAGRTIVEFNGTVGSVRNAFSTDMHRFVVRGEEHFANVSDPKIPAALAKVVAGIPSLHNFRKQSHIKRFGTFERNLSTGEIRPLFTYSDGNGQFFGMGPADFAKIYNVPSTINTVAPGTGQSIAIVARSNINPQDLADFRQMFGLPALTLVNSLSSCTGATPQFCVILNGADPGTPDPGEEGEADLDSEWSGAVAPGATIKFVVSETEQTDAVDGVDASATFIVDNNIAPVMSESFGSCEAFSNNTFENALWQQAAAEGITVSVSAGDNGSAGCDDPNAESSAGQNATAQNPSQGISVSGTASTPFNVAVGGTDFDDAGKQSTFWSATNTSTTAPIPASALGYIPEIPWNDSCADGGLNACSSVPACSPTVGPPCLTIVAGSGGPSAVYVKAQAPFQNGFGDGQRDIPDVSFFASAGLKSKSFYILCQSDQDIPGDTGCNLTKEIQTANCSPCHDFQAVGGTSASAPAFAGVMALVNQKTGQRQGNANFVLYSLAKAETFSSCNSSGFLSGPGTQPAACVFMDITKSNNAVPCVGGSKNCSKTTAGGDGVLQVNNNPAFTAGPPTAAGYDLATGLGSINVSALLSNWTAAGKTSTSTTLNPASITGTVGSSFALSGAVTSGAGTPTGIVVFENPLTGSPEGNIPALNVLAGSITTDPATLNGGSYNVNTAFLPAGTYTLKAHYGGDATFAPSDSTPISVNLAKQNSTTLVRFVNATGQFSTTAQSVQYGSPYMLRVDVTNNAGTTCQNIGNAASNSPLPLSFICPTGAVTLKDGANPLNDFPNAQTPNATNTAQLNNRGFIEDQPIQLPAGMHSITGSYAGDASYNASTSSPLSVTITQATTQATVVGSPSSIVAGGTVTLTATISSASNSSQGPTGTVQFSNGTTNLGAAVTCTPKGATSSAGASCTATLSTTISAFPPLGIDNRWRWTPLEWIATAMLLLSIVLFLLTMRLRGQIQQRRWRGFAFGAIALFLIASATLAGCSGSGGGGGGGGGGSARTITAKYSGDTNYAASQGSGTVTVQ